MKQFALKEFKKRLVLYLFLAGLPFASFPIYNFIWPASAWDVGLERVEYVVLSAGLGFSFFAAAGVVFAIRWRQKKFANDWRIQLEGECRQA